MTDFSRRHGIWIVLVLMQVLSGCNPASPASTTSANSPTKSFSPTGTAVVLGPEAGTSMRWQDSSDVVYVPPGKFVMGKDIEGTVANHEPAHTVQLGGFWIQQTEVTNALYSVCVDLGICAAPAKLPDAKYHYGDRNFANAPVVGVTWQDAATYCDWIDGALPTEAQWEMAARGTGDDPYPWGEDDPDCGLLNFGGCFDPTPDVEVNVRSYPLGASPFDLADTAGNVYEWVFDWYKADYYKDSPAVNPMGPAAGEERVIRGSGYRTETDALPVYLRFSMDPKLARSDLGFRCVLRGDALAHQPPSMCQTLQYQPELAATVTPPPNPSVGVNGSCTWDSHGYPTAWLNILFAEGTDMSDIAIYVNLELDGFTCTPSPGNPLYYSCHGQVMQPGASFMLDICDEHVLDFYEVDLACPPLYEFDPNTDMCQYSPGPEDCSNLPGYIDVPGYGCQPLAQNGICPVGYFPGTYENQEVCVPAGGPPCSGDLCDSACPEGFEYNTDQMCCESPADVQPVCPVTYHFDQDMHNCYNSNVGCTTIYVYAMPACEPKGCTVTKQDPSGGQTVGCEHPCPYEAEPGDLCDIP